MKKFLLGFLVFHFLTFAVDAQIQKGSIMLGGNVNYTNNNSNSDTRAISPNTTRSNCKGSSNSFTFNPKVGFALNNNWVLGPMLILSSSKGTSENNWVSGSNTVTDYTTTKNSSFGGGAFARKYFPFNEHFSAFGEVNATANNRKEYRESSNSSLFSKKMDCHRAFCKYSSIFTFWPKSRDRNSGF